MFQGFPFMVWLVLFLGLSLPLKGRAESEQEEQTMPQITAHSERFLSIYKGDRVSLEVKTTSSNAEIKWLSKEMGVLCRTANCEIDSATWSPGTFTLNLVVFNEKGSVTVNFRLEVKQPSIGYTPIQVKPQLMDEIEYNEVIDKNDLLIKKLRGRGYSYHKKKLQVIGDFPRSLDWEEKLKTQSDSILWFGREKSESHYLGPNATADLHLGESSLRAIKLHSGFLRSRQLDLNLPRWTILVENKIQIDGDAQSDLIVEYIKKTKIRLIVLRGNARVFRKKASSLDESNLENPGPKGFTYYIPQGVEVNFTLDSPKDDELSFLKPQSKKISQIISQTTPFYMRDNKSAAGRLEDSLLREQIPAKFQEALTQAEKAFEESDWLLVLENLAPFHADVRKNFRAAMLLGRAYGEVFLYKDAFNFLRSAAKLLPSSPQPYFLIGTMYLSDRNWKKAIPYLEKAKSLDYPNEQLLNYYLGVAYYRREHFSAANSSFDAAIWQEGAETIKESARLFRQKSSQENSFEIYFQGDLFYDENILRASKINQEQLKSRETNPISDNKSLGYFGAIGVSLWGLHSREVKLGLILDLSRRGYENETLQAFDQVDQKASVKLDLNFGGTVEKKPFIGLRALGYARMIFLGKTRAADQMGSSLSLGSPEFFDLFLGIHPDFVLDPLPGQDDIYEPFLEEIVPISERSHRTLLYSLSAKPFVNRAMEISTELETGEKNYHHISGIKDSFTQKQAQILLEYRVFTRHYFKGGITLRFREFPKSDDSRNDENTRIRLGWITKWSDHLDGEFSLIQEKQSSNRKSREYSRQLISYGLGLKF